MRKTKRKPRRQKRRAADRGRWQQVAFRAVWSLEGRRPEEPRSLPRVLEDRADGGMERLATFRAGGGS